MQTHTIETSVHGRFLHEPRDPARLLVGFHGYAETAEVHMEQLANLPGAGEWSLVAVQALHPFYTRQGTVVASWMTALDRELAIADNILYVQRVLKAVPRPETLVFLGFSQGAAMAARAAAFAEANPAGLILLGGDIPPEVVEREAALPPVLLARGARDEWYSEEKFKKDVSFLESRTKLTALPFDGGHEWADAFRTAAGQFLAHYTEG